jgi:hypothetical protein
LANMNRATICRKEVMREKSDGHGKLVTQLTLRCQGLRRLKSTSNDKADRHLSAHTPRQNTKQKHSMLNDETPALTGVMKIIVSPTMK